MQTASTAETTNLAVNLVSASPDPELADRLMDFGQFVGGWEIEGEDYLEDGTVKPFRGEVHYGWVLDGQAIQDVWLLRAGEPPRLVPEGTTFRFFDRALNAWQCVWIAHRRGVVTTLIARAEDGRIVMNGTHSKGHPMQWIYSDITPESFRWHAVESFDGGQTWRKTEEMRMRRLRSR